MTDLATENWAQRAIRFVDIGGASDQTVANVLFLQGDATMAGNLSVTIMVGATPMVVVVAVSSGASEAQMTQDLASEIQLQTGYPVAVYNHVPPDAHYLVVNRGNDVAFSSTSGPSGVFIVDQALGYHDGIDLVELSALCWNFADADTETIDVFMSRTRRSSCRVARRRPVGTIQLLSVSRKCRM